MKRKMVRLTAVGLFGVVLLTSCLYGSTKNADDIDGIPIVSESEIDATDTDPIVIGQLESVNNSEPASKTVEDAILIDEISSDYGENVSQLSPESPKTDNTMSIDTPASSDKANSSKDKTPAGSTTAQNERNENTAGKPGSMNNKVPSSPSTGTSGGTGSSSTKPVNGSSENKQPTPNQTEKPVIKEDPVPSVKPTEPEKPVHTHAYSSSITTKATCTSEGVKTFTCSCGDSYTEKIAKVDHVCEAHTTKVWVVDQPAYSEPVKTVYGGYKCNSCGAKYTKEECEAGALIAHQKETDHSGTSSWSDFKITTVKHEEVGHYEEHTTYSCSVCGMAK